MSPKVLEAIRNRRSIKNFLPKEVPKEVLRRVLEAAIWAPSAHNAQPWRFIFVADHDVKRRLAEAMAEEWDKDLKEDGLSREDRERLTEASIKQFTQPPVVIIACLSMEDMDTYSDERRRKAEYIMTVQSVAASVQNILLAFHAEGLGACWFCAPLFCPERVRKVLGVPENVEPQALIVAGFPAEKLGAPPRRPLTSVVYENYWGCTS
jgi:F420 biosynthesis protein FbiB-like protein